MLVPSLQLVDVGKLEQCTLPREVTFWRHVYDELGHRLGLALHRNPLFAEDLGTSPVASLAIDTLHALNYGPMSRWTHMALVRMIALNPWRIQGTQPQIAEVATRRLRGHLMKWFQRKQVPHENRLNDLTLKMIGYEASDETAGELKLKAHEIWILLLWCVDLIQELGTHMHMYEDMLKAGQAIVHFMNVMRQAPMRVPPPQQQELFDAMLEHLIHADLAGIECVPKHHYCAHLVERIQKA